MYVQRAYICTVKQKQPRTMKAQVIAELSKLGMYTATGSFGELFAERISQKIAAVKFYRAEGCDRLAEAELTNTTFGPKIIGIVKQLAA